MKNFLSSALVLVLFAGMLGSPAQAQPTLRINNLSLQDSNFPLLVQTLIQGGSISPHAVSEIQFKVRSKDIIEGVPSSTPLPGINLIYVRGIVNLDASNALTDNALSISVIDSNGLVVSSGGTCVTFPPHGRHCQAIFLISEVNVTLGTSNELIGDMRLRVQKNDGSNIYVKFTLN